MTGFFIMIGMIWVAEAIEKAAKTYAEALKYRAAADVAEASMKGPGHE